MICKDAARILLSEFREAEVIRFLHEDFGPGWQVIFQRREGSYEVLTKSDTISCGAEGREGWEPWHFDDEECGLGDALKIVREVGFTSAKLSWTELEWNGEF